jgi:hypothetical protein
MATKSRGGPIFRLHRSKPQRSSGKQLCSIHLKFAQPRTLGRKVSDEFTVPLCREHHRDLHRYGNEIAWWANVQIAPIEAAKELRQTTLLDPNGPIASGISPLPHDGTIRAAD